MLNASHQPTEVCTHERRPGTTVCLHCRHEARVLARVRRKQLVLRGGALVVALAVVGTAGLLSAGALRNRAAKRGTPAPIVTIAESSPAKDSGTSAAAANGPNTSATVPTNVPVAQQGELARRDGAPASPVIAMGQTSLGNGVTAVRDDSTVTLAFDTPDIRTRMPDKFERFIRTTLPRIYGAAADSALAALPMGNIVSSQKVLLYDLPTRGIHIALHAGWSIALYPETRAGQDGPLVVRYRASVVDRPY